jgi:hypothetical protein
MNNKCLCKVLGKNNITKSVMFQHINRQLPEKEIKKIPSAMLQNENYLGIN